MLTMLKLNFLVFTSEARVENGLVAHCSRTKVTVRIVVSVTVSKHGETKTQTRCT